MEIHKSIWYQDLWSKVEFLLFEPFIIDIDRDGFYVWLKSFSCYGNEVKMADKWGYQIMEIHKNIAIRYRDLWSKVEFLFVFFPICFPSCGNDVLNVNRIWTKSLNWLTGTEKGRVSLTNLSRNVLTLAKNIQLRESFLLFFFLVCCNLYVWIIT